MAGISPESLAYQQAHITEDRSGGLKVVYVLGFILAFIAVVLRVVARKISNVPLKADDWTIIATMFVMVGLSIDNFLGVFRFGLGRHAVAVAADGQLTNFVKDLYAYSIFYNTVILGAKNSVLLLYYRIFIVKRFRLIVKISLVLLNCYQVATLLSDIFICTPIKTYWDPTVPGRCVNQVALWYASAAINILTDVWILVLPMPMIWRLKIPTRQKLVVCSLFLLGGLVCIATIMRLVTFHLVDYEDVTWTIVDSAYWSNSEIPLAIICACLPAMRPIFQRVSKASWLLPGSTHKSGSSQSPKATKQSFAQGQGTHNAWPGHGESTTNIALSQSDKPSASTETDAWFERDKEPGVEDLERGIAKRTDVDVGYE